VSLGKELMILEWRILSRNNNPKPEIEDEFEFEFDLD
jgi:hypothetical protein